jgi:hypothetical protein
VSYFEGDEKQGLAPDTEAKQLWLDLGVAEDHIIKGNAKDNFWGEYNNIGSVEKLWLIQMSWVNRDGCNRTLRTLL